MKAESNIINQQQCKMLRLRPDRIIVIIIIIIINTLFEIEKIFT